jgi:hypothetical protein
MNKEKSVSGVVELGNNISCSGKVEEKIIYRKSI